MSDCINGVKLTVPDFLTVKEFAAIIGVSKCTVYRWTNLKNEKGEFLINKKVFSNPKRS